MSLPRQSPAPLSYSSGLFRDRLRAFAKRVNTIVTQGQGGRGGCHLLGRLDCLYACVSVCTCVLVCVWKWFLCEEVRACEGVCVWRSGPVRARDEAHSLPIHGSLERRA